MRLALLVAILLAAGLLGAASLAGEATVAGIAWSKCAGALLLGAGALMVRGGLALGRPSTP
jgi:hypothetical protein